MTVDQQSMAAVLNAVVFVFGACVGSFLNVCIYRIPRGESIVWPGSHCPSCGKPIAWYDNIPLLSYVILRGRCRHCGGRIAPRYFLVELLTAVLFSLIWRHYGLHVETAVYWLLTAGLIVGTFVDFEHMIIPDRVTLGGIAAGLVLSGVFPQLHGVTGSLGGLRASVYGILLGAGLLWTVGAFGKLLFKKEAMGLGDVKLLAAIGAFMGWRAVLFTVMLSALMGSLAGGLLILVGRHSLGSRIPYGPYLALAALIWILWGGQWWAEYVQWTARLGM